jgi:glutathione peroxidase
MIMRNIIKLLTFFGATLLSGCIPHNAPKPSDKTAYDFNFEGLNGEKMPLSHYKGKVLLVVNTASKCGFTAQYKDLEELYNKYKDKGFVVIGVPSNDFGQQEPGTASEIHNFCQLNYGVTFPMTSKQVVTGEDAHPFYQWAYSVLGWGSAPKWNFHKYLIDRNGHLVDYYVSTTKPDDPGLVSKIEELLSKKP